MTDKDLERFTDLMNGLADNFSAELSTPGLKMRFKVLKSFSIQEIEQAAYNLLATRKFTKMPTVADFLEAMGYGAGSLEDRAETALATVLKAMSSIGAYESVAFEDPVITAVIERMGGWPKCCLTEGGELTWWEKDFRKIYMSFFREGIKRTGHLPGLTEIDNHANGYFDHIPKPKLIADENKNKGTAKIENTTPAKLLTSYPENPDN